MKNTNKLEQAIMNDKMDEWREQKRREYLASPQHHRRHAPARSWQDIPVGTLLIIAAVIMAIVDTLSK